MKKNLLFIVIMLLATGTFAKQGYYLEFKITSASMSGTTKTYAADGNTRTELNMKSAAMAEPIATATIHMASTPDVNYMVNDKSKTYSELPMGNSDKQFDDEMEVTVVGKERVNDYNCTHVKVKFKSAKHEMDMWLSKEVEGYSGFTSIKNKFLGGSKFFDQLKAKGADGFVVRMLTPGTREGESMQMDLVKAEKRDVDASLFSISGYTKAAGTTIPGMSKTVEELKAMTPEERQKYIEEMKAKYQQH